MKSSNKITKQITLFKYESYNKYSYGHIKENENKNKSNYSLSFPIESDKLISIANSYSSIISCFGVFKSKSNEVYSGFMIASNLFLTVLKGKTENHLRKEVGVFKGGFVVFSNQHFIHIRKGKKVGNSLVVLVLDEDIGDEIGYRGVSDHENNINSKIELSYDEKNESICYNINICLLTRFVFQLLKGIYYINEVGNERITNEIISQIDKIYVKNQKYYSLIGVSSNNKKTFKKLINFHFPKFEFLHKDENLEDMKLTNHLKSINQIIISECSINNKYLMRNKIYFEKGGINIISLSNNQIVYKDIKPFFKFQLFNIEYLNISFNKIGDDGIKYFSKIKLPNLKVLNISRNLIGDKGMKYFSTMSFLCLKKLNISYNQIGYVGMEYFSKMSFTYLEEIILCGNLIGFKGLEWFSKMSFPNLENVLMAANQIGDKGMEYLSKMSLPYLRHLNVSFNQIGNCGFECFTQMSLKYLYHLDINRNQISLKGMKFFSNVSLPHLHYLDISKNQIGDEGVKILYEMSLLNLESINMRWNQIGDVGKEIISKMKFLKKHY